MSHAYYLICFCLVSVRSRTSFECVLVRVVRRADVFVMGKERSVVVVVASVY